MLYKEIIVNDDPKCSAILATVYRCSLRNVCMKWSYSHHRIKNKLNGKQISSLIILLIRNLSNVCPHLVNRWNRFQGIYFEPVFVNLIDTQPGGPVYDNPIWRTGPPGYIGWQNRGIDSWAPQTFTNSFSGGPVRQPYSYSVPSPP